MTITPEPIRRLETDEKIPLGLVAHTCRVVLRERGNPDVYWLLKHEFVKQNGGVRRFALPLQSVRRYAFTMVRRVLKVYIEYLPSNQVALSYRCVLSVKSRGFRNNYHVVLVTVPKCVIKDMLEEEHIKPIDMPPATMPEKRTALVLRSMFGWWMQNKKTSIAVAA